MPQLPASPPRQLCHNDITIPKNIDVELQMTNGRTRDVHLWDLAQKWNDFGDGRNFKRRADDDDKIDEVFVMFGEALRESRRKLLAKEGDVWFHDSSFRELVIRVIAAGAIIAAVPFAHTLLLSSAVQRALALRTCIAEGSVDESNALLASWDGVGFDIGEDGIARDLGAALGAAGCGERTVALDKLVGWYASPTFKVIDVLGVVCEKFAFIMEELDESVGWGESLGFGQDVFGNAVENFGVFAEEFDVKDFLRIAETEVFEFRVKPDVL